MTRDGIVLYCIVFYCIVYISQTTSLICNDNECVHPIYIRVCSLSEKGSDEKGSDEAGTEVESLCAQAVYFHVLGAVAEDDICVFTPKDPKWLSGIEVTEDGKYLLITVSSTGS